MYTHIIVSYQPSLGSGNKICSISFQTLVHGDSKIDNFMFKKVSWSYHVDGPDDVYNAVIVDWQGMLIDVQPEEPKRFLPNALRCLYLNFLSC